MNPSPTPPVVERQGSETGAAEGSLLSARGLWRTFDDRRRGGPGVVALAGADLAVGRGEVHALVGESGSGKSTLGKAILRLVALDAGQVWFDGAQVHSLDSASLRRFRQRCQWIPQNASAALNPGLTVRDHLEESIRLHRPDEWARRAEVVAEVSGTFRLGGRLDHRPGTLSGGERRRVVVARALLPQPHLIVADEPTAGLDAAHKSDVLAEMLAARHGQTSWLLISHELDVVRVVADTVSIMVGGLVVERVRGSDLRAPSGVRHPYSRMLVASGLDAGPAPLPTIQRGPQPGGGCPFVTRCPATAPSDPWWTRCTTQRPPLIGRRDGSAVACFRPEFATESP